MSASPRTPLDYIAAGYWQDFLAERPIAGGIAYEAELRDCMLDESLASLQRIDTLLSQIRRELMKIGQWQEQALLIDERYRNFMVFLAFYTGRVLAQHWQMTPHWYGQFELGKRYADLPLITDNFYQHMAVVYRDDSDTANIKPDIDALFFALEPIGLRLFGHIDRPFVAVQGGELASGLYQAVSARLPDANHNKKTDVISQDTTTTSLPPAIQKIKINADVKHDVSNNAGSHINKDARLAKTKVENNLSERQRQNKPELSKIDPQPEIVKSTEKGQPASVASALPTEPLLIQAVPVVKTSPTPEMFTQLLLELDEIEVAQTAGHREYQQAYQVLNQFEQHIAKQNKPRAQVSFSKDHLAAKKQALFNLQNAANAGNTAAMLYLAMYELLDEGLAEDKSTATESADEAGVDWVKQAASKNDSRAQRLLSKMYYQGIGVSQDMANGKYWLEQAAENGHAEAASVVSQWQQAQTLITTQKQEQHSIKRYQLLFAAIVIVAVLIFIIV